MSDAKKCGNPACSCIPPEKEKFCSAHCEGLKGVGRDHVPVWTSCLPWRRCEGVSLSKCGFGPIAGPSSAGY